MRVSGRKLNKKEDSPYRPAQPPIYEQPTYQTEPTYRQPINQQPIVVRKNYTGLIVAGVILGLVIAIPVVLMVVGVIGAIAVPNLLASRQAANEATAISHLRTFHGAEATYQATSGAGSFGSFDELVKTGLIAEQPRGFGYEYTLTRSASGTRYCIAANSANPNGAQKQRSFAVTGEGVIYVSETGAIDCRDGELSGGTMKRLQ